MEPAEARFFCGKSDSARNLGLWLVDSERRTVHLACWIIAYEARTGDEQTAA